MESSTLTPFITIAIIIIAGLFSWAITLLWRLYRTNTTHEESALQQNSQARSQARMSIVVLARGALSQQVDTTEAAIRLATLLDYLDDGNRPRQRYAQVFHLSEATAHIPRLDEWRQLDKAEKRKYRKQMQELERQHSRQMNETLQRLVSDFGE